MRGIRTTCILTIFLASLSLWGPPASAQEIDAVLTGYATTGYEARLADSLQHNFSASFTPVTLFEMGQDVLFEGEVDFGLHDGSTTVTLEHAQVHYLGWDRVQFTAGKFHLPFGIWMHPSWINKMPSPPLLYGHAHGGIAEEALLPILFDVGVKAMGKAPVGESWSLGGAVWVSQGPVRSPEAGHGHEAGQEHGGETSSAEDHALEIPPIGYGINYTDNNANKMVGARLRLMNMRNVTIGLAGYYAQYDPAGQLGIQGANLSVKWHPGRYDLRGEGILLNQEFLHHSAVESARLGGYYLQITRRVEAFEPVLRWSHLPHSHVEGETVQDERRELALGLNYWISPSIPVKVAYEWGVDTPDAVRLQWAFGF